MAEPNPSNVSPWYLRNITQALALDETTGNVYVRTDAQIDIGNANITVGNVDIASFGNVDISGNTLPVTVDSGNITITGGNVNATVSGTVAVSSITGNLAGITGNVTVVDGGGSLTVDGNVGITGNVDIGTMPNVNASVSGNVGVTSLGNVVLTGNTLPVSGNVNANITNANIEVTQGTDPWVVSGNVGITNTVSVREDGATKTTAFNEPVGITIYPVVQQEAVYGLATDKTSVYTAGTGNVSGANSTIVLSTGTTQYSYATVQSVRGVRYRPGQGSLCRFTAYFANPTLGYTQRAGYGSLENALQVGYSDTSPNASPQFGVLRASGGLATIYRLTVTNPATGGGSTVTITLNGVDFVLSVPSGTAAQNAAYIADQTFTGWNAEAGDNLVTFQRQSLGVTSGAFAVSATGAFTGTMTSLQTGVPQTENWTYQSDFNIDTLDGNGPSGMVLDPSKLNVYQINFRWLGAGEIRYAIEDSLNGNMIFFHHEHYANEYTTPHLLNPTMKIQYVAASLGGTGANVITGGSSIMGATEGEIVLTNYPNAVGSSIGTISSTTYQHLLSLRNNQVFNNKINQREIILKRLSAACNSASSSPVQIYIYKNITTADERLWQYIGSGSTACYSTTDTTINYDSARVIFQTVVIPGGANEIDLGDLRIILAPGETLAVGLYGTNVIQNAACALTWYED